MAERSIHYRRRWFYALWSALLVASTAALLLWERPSVVDLASLQVVVRVPGAPEGTRIQAWAGPWAKWPGRTWSGGDAFAELAPGPGGAATLPVVRMAIARRRWFRGTIPRGTWDLVMVKFTPPSEPPRYLAVPMSRDIRAGLLRPRYRLIVTINTSWQNLTVDAEAPNRIP